MMQLRQVLVVLVAGLLAVAGCSAPTGTGGPDGPGAGTSIVIGAGSEQETLNPILGYAPDGASKIFDGLVARDANLQLVYPYAPFGQRLALGIVPEKAFDGVDINTAPFNIAPIGTGPYTVAEWRKGDRMVLKANESYWGGVPAVKTATFVFVSDDNARATRMAAGEFDATVLPPKLAKTYAGREGFRVIENESADYRGLGIPSELPFTSDPAVRLAINAGINRQAMVDTVLAGSGLPAATPVSPYLSQWYDEDATFTYDPAEAGTLLDGAGWVLGPDGKRSKGGQQAQLPILYPAEDSLRKELALTTASDIAKLGIDAPVEGTTFEIMLERQKETASIWGGGDPFDPDTAAYTLLNSRYIGQEGYVNMTLYRNVQVDAALDAGRATIDPAARKAAYDAFQTAYVADPGWAFLVFLNHTYVLKDGWTGQVPQVEPHDHGLLHGPWWNLEKWTPTAS